ncbi:MAG TPA: 1-deoxy-D-xylulose-5-phosphate synthase, partial [Elusimicrobia bacterium]|nr:1-deoxy-D-xylulose-5-phosphate synthase [Elusimicrobiota bacterium]
APADENELQHMLRTALTMGGPAVMRYPRGVGVGVAMDPEAQPLPMGKGMRLKDGSAVTILTIGNRTHPAIEAAQLLDDHGISTGVINMRFVKPLDAEMLRAAAASTPRLVTVEDNALQCGFGSAVLEALHDHHGVRVLRLGIPDRFVEHGSLDQLFNVVGISAPGIAQRVAAWMERPIRNATEPAGAIG